jgi:hypothetical protein
MGANTFPHPELTVIITGKPTNSSLQLLQRQLYTNARSVPSAQGRGNNGHLALLMNNIAYTARAGVAFDIPIYPGPAPLLRMLLALHQLPRLLKTFVYLLKS